MYTCSQSSISRACVSQICIYQNLEIENTALLLLELVVYFVYFAWEFLKLSEGVYGGCVYVTVCVCVCVVCVVCRSWFR